MTTPRNLPKSNSIDKNEFNQAINKCQSNVEHTIIKFLNLDKLERGKNHRSVAGSRSSSASLEDNASDEERRLPTEDS